MHTGSTAFALEIMALRQVIAEKDAQIEQLKFLLTRAADAVDPRITISLNYDQACELSNQLRNAAE